MQVVPAVSRGHSEKCHVRAAETWAVPIECEHGFDVCPICDSCSCGIVGAEFCREEVPHYTREPDGVTVVEPLMCRAPVRSNCCEAGHEQPTDGEQS